MGLERVPGESLTAAVKSGYNVTLKKLSAYAEKNLTLIVERTARLTIASGVACPHTVIDSGEVYIESAASRTINQANGQNVYT